MEELHVTNEFFWVWGIFIALTTLIAHRKKRKKFIWLPLSLVLGPIALVILLFLKKKYTDYNDDDEMDAEFGCNALDIAIIDGPDISGSFFGQ